MRHSTPGPKDAGSPLSVSDKKGLCAFAFDFSMHTVLFSIVLFLPFSQIVVFFAWLGYFVHRNSVEFDFNMSCHNAPLRYRGAGLPLLFTEPACESIPALLPVPVDDYEAAYPASSCCFSPSKEDRTEPMTGDFAEVRIISLLDDGTVTFWTADSSGEFAAERISERLATVYASKSTAFRLFRYRKGQPVVVELAELRTSPCRFGRGIFVDSHLNGQATVDLVDFEQRVRVPYGNVYPLGEEFACLLRTKVWTALVEDVGNRLSAPSPEKAFLRAKLQKNDACITATITETNPLSVDLRINNHCLDMLLWHRSKENEGRRVDMGTIFSAYDGGYLCLLPYRDFPTLQKVKRQLAFEDKLDERPKLAVGALIGMRFPGGLCYRGKIVRQDDEKTYTCSFWDYGGSVWAHDCHMFAISAELQKLPQLARRCKLASLPKDRFADPRVLAWLEKFCDMSDPYAPVGELSVPCLYERSEVENGGSPEISIWDKSGTSEELVNGTTVFSMSGISTPLSGSTDSYHTTLETLDSPAARRASSTPRLQKYEMKIVDCQNFPHYCENSILEVTVSRVNDPSSIVLFDSDPSVNEEFDKMCKEKDRIVDKLPHLDELPALHVLVLARFSADRNWYRGGVLRHCDSRAAIVVFIDYGNFERISLDDLRPLPEGLAEYPLMCLNVILTSLRVGGYSDDLTEKASALVNSYPSKFLRIRKVNGIDVYGELLLENKTGRLSAAELFIERGIAAEDRS